MVRDERWISQLATACLGIGNHYENLNPTTHTPHSTMSSEEPTTKRPAIAPGEDAADANMADTPIAKKPRLDSRDAGGVADIKPEWVSFSSSSSFPLYSSFSDSIELDSSSTTPPV